MPMDKSRYGANWKKISLTIRRIAEQRCEFCGIPNGSVLPSGRDGKVVLTVAHLGVPYANGVPSSKHDKHDVRRENLACLCQRCHLGYDMDDHIAHAKATRQRKIREQAVQAGQMSLLWEGENL